MAVTIKASKQGLKKVEEARKKKGWKADSFSWCEAAKTSPATLKRFRAGKRIQKETFIEICKAVGLNWEEIVDDTPPTEVQDSILYLTLNATLQEVDRPKAEAIVAFVNKILEGEHARLFRIEQGSVVLVLESSLETFERIEYLFTTGQLRSILGIEIEGVRLESAEVVNLRDWLENLYQRDWQPVERVLAPAAHRGDRPTATPEAIAADLITRLQRAHDQGIVRLLATTLGDIAPGNVEAIDIAEQLRSSQDEETRWQASFSLAKIDPGNPKAAVKRAKIVSLETQPEPVRAALIVSIRPDTYEEVSIRVRVEATNAKTSLPSNLKLALLDNSGDAFIEAKTGSENFVQREFNGPVGERFTVRLSVGDVSIAENFIIGANPKKISMTKQVILTLLEGNLQQQGFRALLRIKGDREIQMSGHLPPEPSIFQLYSDWKFGYYDLPGLRGSPFKEKSYSTTRSPQQLAEELENTLNAWLNSGDRDWQKIRDALLRHLNEGEEIEVIIQTKDDKLRQLPWKLWNLLDDYKAEVAISAPEFRPPLLGRLLDSDRARILAIQGNPKTADNQTEIKNQADIDLLKQHFSGAEIVTLVEPTPEQLRESLRDRQGWQILFFAGHSDSEPDNETGSIKINSNDWITVRELKNALRTAIENGLHLTIFNSCNGLGLANQLEDLHLPQIIVMRERVLDSAAVEFLQYFLDAFSSNKSLYASMREARSKLEGWDERYPGTTWLPVICQNPAVQPLTWEELVGKRWILKHTLTAHSDFVKTVAISPDNKILASGGGDNIIKLWDFTTGQWMRDLTGHSSAIQALAFSHDGKTLASASNMEFMDGTIKLWDTKTWKLKQTLGTALVALRTCAIAFSPDDNSLVTAHLGAKVPFDAGINVWNLATGKVRKTLSGHGWEARSLAFTSDRQYLVSGGTDGAIKIWNWPSGELVATLNRPEPSDITGAIIGWFASYSEFIWCTDISPDGQIVASGDSNGLVKLWNIKEKKVIRTLTEHSRDVMSLAFSPDGEIIASASDDNTVKIWNVATGECLDTLQHQNRVHCVAFSSDGKILVSGSSDQTIKVWERLGL